MEIVLDKVIGTIFEKGLVPEGYGGVSPIVLMVSGGSDSTAMCLVAEKLAAKSLLNKDAITILHVEHGLRGQDSYEDMQFTKDLAKRCGFDCVVRFANVLEHLDEHGGNVENAARNIRYELAETLCDELCEKAGVEPLAGRIWVAHTQDDKVETFYMRSIVGTGPGGFSCIPFENGRVVRPLLETSRDDLRDYIRERADAKGIPDDERLWREDMTNFDSKGFRAFVRHDMVPLAKEKNPALLSTLCRTIDLIADEDSMLKGVIDNVKGRVFSLAEDGTHVLDLAETFELPLPMRRRLFYSICKDLLPVDERIEYKHIDLLVSSSNRNNFSMCLPGAIYVENEYGKLIFSQKTEARGGMPSDTLFDYKDDVTLPICGHVYLGLNERVQVSDVTIPTDMSKVAFAKENANSSRIYVDKAIAIAACKEHENDSTPALTITKRREGDVLCPLGMGGMHKKLSDVFIDSKVRRSERYKAIVIRAGSCIVWVVGLVVDERFKVHEKSDVLCISVEDTIASQMDMPAI